MVLAAAVAQLTIASNNSFPQGSGQSRGVVQQPGKTPSTKRREQFLHSLSFFRIRQTSSWSHWSFIKVVAGSLHRFCVSCSLGRSGLDHVAHRPAPQFQVLSSVVNSH